MDLTSIASLAGTAWNAFRGTQWEHLTLIGIVGVLVVAVLWKGVRWMRRATPPSENAANLLKLIDRERPTNILAGASIATLEYPWGKVAAQKPYRKWYGWKVPVWLMQASVPPVDYLKQLSPTDQRLIAAHVFVVVERHAEEDRQSQAALAAELLRMRVQGLPNGYGMRRSAGRLIVDGEQKFAGDVEPGCSPPKAHDCPVAGNVPPPGKKPTIAELEEILNSEGHHVIEVFPDGSVRAKSACCDEPSTVDRSPLPSGVNLPMNHPGRKG